MKTNLGSVDVGIRYILGCAILFWGVHQATWWGLLGLAPLLTAIFGFCPLYRPFRLDTTVFDQPHRDDSN
jgi:hypothetical protein